MYIESQDELVSFVQRAANSSLLAIDTEFLREKTYYAKLCLLQIATDDEVVIIDPLAVSDITALAPLLVDERIVKIFHAGHQDLELLYRNVGVLPSPVFDTQIAAALLGHTQQIGYGSLVGALCGVRIKKADSFTDWSHRPLSDSQIQYAGEDVVYLPKIYATMKRRLEEKGRLEWLRNDFAELSDPSRYEVDERERFRRLKHVSSLSRCQMAAAREMAAWREAAARERNIPRKWVLSDEQIVEACKREPRTIDDLFMVRGMRERLNVRDARTIISRVASAMNAPASTWPASGNPSKSEPNVDMQVDLMMAIVRMRARENDIAIPTLASHDDLTKIARGYCDDVEILRGWRRELIGAELLDLLNGRIALSVENGSVRVDRF